MVLADIRWMTLAVFGFTMMVPLGSLFAPTTFKHGLLIYAVVLALVGVMAIFITFSGGELVNMFSAAYLLGFVAYQGVANFLLIREDNQ